MVSHLRILEKCGVDATKEDGNCLPAREWYRKVIRPIEKEKEKQKVTQPVPKDSKLSSKHHAKEGHVHGHQHSHTHSHGNSHGHTHSYGPVHAHSHSTASQPHGAVRPPPPAHSRSKKVPPSTNTRGIHSKSGSGILDGKK